MAAATCFATSAFERGRRQKHTSMPPRAISSQPSVPTKVQCPRRQRWLTSCQSCSIVASPQADVGLGTNSSLSAPCSPSQLASHTLHLTAINRVPAPCRQDRLNRHPSQSRRLSRASEKELRLSGPSSPNKESLDKTSLSQRQMLKSQICPRQLYAHVRPPTAPRLYHAMEKQSRENPCLDSIRTRCHVSPARCCSTAVRHSRWSGETARTGVL